MEQLTAQQSKVVIEYFAAQAAEDAPEHDADKHMWVTRYQASIAIERQITEADWDALVARMSDLQSFDRDAAGYLHAAGWADADNVQAQAQTEDHLKVMISWAIDTAYACSGV